MKEELEPITFEEFIKDKEKINTEPEHLEMEAEEDPVFSQFVDFTEWQDSVGVDIDKLIKKLKELKEKGWEKISAYYNDGEGFADIRVSKENLETDVEFHERMEDEYKEYIEEFNRLKELRDESAKKIKSMSRKVVKS